MLDDWKQANLVWVLLIILIGYCEYMNFSKCMFFPPSDRDSLAAFDTLGFVAAQDHTYMRMSLFDADYNPSIHRAGGSIAYAPFVQMSYAYVYILGAETSKSIPALMYLFFVIAFYGILRRNTGKTVAALSTLFMMMAPEMLAFSSLSTTNVMQAIFAGLGIAYTASWLRSRNDDELYAGALLLGANMWCRNEGIVFIGAACVILLIDCIQPQELSKRIVLYRVVPAPGHYLVYLHENRGLIYRRHGYYPPVLGRGESGIDRKRLLGFVYQSHILWLDILGIRHFYSREQLVHD